MNMSKRPRRNHSPLFKAKVAIDAIKGDKTLAELAKLHDVHANQIVDWKNQLLGGAASVFGPESTTAAPAIDLKELHAKIGQLALENDFLAGALSKAGMLSVKR
jgi:transposase-like protein